MRQRLRHSPLVEADARRGRQQVSGLWTRRADSTYGRKYFASAVLADGRLLVCGGEYSDVSGSNSQDNTGKRELYDPVANSWTEISPPAGVTQIGD